MESWGVHYTSVPRVAGDSRVGWPLDCLGSKRLICVRSPFGKAYHEIYFPSTCCHAKNLRVTLQGSDVGLIFRESRTQ